MQCNVQTDYKQLTKHCIINTTHSALTTTHSTINILHKTQHTNHCTLHTTHCRMYTAYFKLHTKLACKVGGGQMSRSLSCRKLRWNYVQCSVKTVQCCEMHWQYWILLEQEQWKAYKPFLHWGRVYPESASSPVIANKWRQGCFYNHETIAPFSELSSYLVEAEIYSLSSCWCN